MKGKSGSTLRYRGTVPVTVPTGVCIEVLVAIVTPGGTAAPGMFVFLRQFAENGNPNPTAVPSEILRLPRLRSTDPLVDERKQRFVFFPFHPVPPIPVGFFESRGISAFPGRNFREYQGCPFKHPETKKGLRIGNPQPLGIHGRDDWI
jgi:hypothetical protein